MADSVVGSGDGSPRSRESPRGDAGGYEDNEPLPLARRDRKGTTGTQAFGSARKKTTRRATELRGSKTSSGATFADWASSVGLDTGVPPSPRGSGRREPTLKRKDRKRTQTVQAFSIAQVIDDAAETTVYRTVEQPLCMDLCAGYSSCQRVCFPAERASRLHKGDRDEAMGLSPNTTKRGKLLDVGDNELPSFGLPDFSKAGYQLRSMEDVGCVDPCVGGILGLQIATHMKTSSQRYCFQQHKLDLPTSLTAAEIRTGFRSLKRCDHVNVLAFLDGFEDEEYVYVMYEYFPCITLRFILDRQNWTQAQVVNMIREMCAALASASSANLVHMGFTLCHVLVPARAATGGDPMACKIFGIGLMGMLYLDTFDHLCWAPEALERSMQMVKGGNFIQKMEPAIRQACDSWSLGVLSYALVSKQLPMNTEQQVLAKKWHFTFAVEEIDQEAKSLIDGFLTNKTDARLKADRAIHHEWIRRRWRPPSGATKAVAKLEEFCCSSPLPKRLFGRFLATFLEPSHRMLIVKPFYSLDGQGTGTITLKALLAAVKAAGRPLGVAEAIFNYLASEGDTSISMSRFVECFAEEIIDGRALRHAFESLDDDASEEVSPEELFGALRALDERGQLSMDEVVTYISTCRGIAGNTKKKQEHNLRFAEFCNLFPVRVKRMKAMTQRMTGERETADELASQFNRRAQDIRAWIGGIEGLTERISELSARTLDRGESGHDAARALRKEFTRMDELLKQPPGPANAEEFEQLVAQRKKEHGKKDRRGNVVVDKSAADEVLGFETFVQDQALNESFSMIMATDFRSLKQALNIGNKVSAAVDKEKAHDAAQSVCSRVGDALRRTKCQMQEYEAFVEAMCEPEASMMSGTGGFQLSGRGLRQRPAENAKARPKKTKILPENINENHMAQFLMEVANRLTNR